jgi:hypothetical protein
LLTVPDFFGFRRRIRGPHRFLFLGVLRQPQPELRHIQPANLVGDRAGLFAPTEAFACPGTEIFGKVHAGSPSAARYRIGKR